MVKVGEVRHHQRRPLAAASEEDLTQLAVEVVGERAGVVGRGRRGPEPRQQRLEQRQQQGVVLHDRQDQLAPADRTAAIDVKACLGTGGAGELVGKHRHAVVAARGRFAQQRRRAFGQLLESVEDAVLAHRAHGQDTRPDGVRHEARRHGLLVPGAASLRDEAAQRIDVVLLRDRIEAEHHQVGGFAERTGNPATHQHHCRRRHPDQDDGGGQARGAARCGEEPRPEQDRSQQAGGDGGGRQLAEPTEHGLRGDPWVKEQDAESEPRVEQHRLGQHLETEAAQLRRRAEVREQEPQDAERQRGAEQQVGQKEHQARRRTARRLRPADPEVGNPPRLQHRQEGALQRPHGKNDDGVRAETASGQPESRHLAPSTRW